MRSRLESHDSWASGRRLRTLALAFLCIAALCGSAAAQDVDALLQAVATGKTWEGDPATVVPQLTQLIERGNQLDVDLAVRAVAQIGRPAAAATPAVCKLLDAPEAATRGWAMEALVAIGEPAIAPVQALLQAPTPRCRTASLLVLARLHQAQLADAQQAASDVDPRVRAAAALALADLGVPAIAPLLALADDPDSAVAAMAAQALVQNQADPDAAIAKLTQMLQRADIARLAAAALGEYGIRARSAVPAIIAGPPESVHVSTRWELEASDALVHIGPPDATSLEAMRPLLQHPDEERQLLATYALRQMGTEARPLAADLEAAIDVTLVRYHEAVRWSEAHPDDYVHDNSGRISVTVAELTITLWDVTHDVDRFLRTAEHVAKEVGWLSLSSSPALLEELSAVDTTRLIAVLQDGDSTLQWAILNGLRRLDQPAEALRPAVIQILIAGDPELTSPALFALEQFGPGGPEDLAPQLLKLYRADRIQLWPLARVAGHLKLKDPELRQLLEEGATDGFIVNQNLVEACSLALVRIADDPDAAVAQLRDQLVQKKASRDRLKAVFAEEAVAPDIAIPMLIEDLQASGRSAESAAESLGRYGPAASAALPDLRRLAQKTNPENQGTAASAAKAIYLIAGETGAVDDVLQKNLAGGDRNGRLIALNLLSSLGSAGTPFQSYLLQLVALDDDFISGYAIPALGEIRSPEAVATLQELAQSQDWAIRTWARDGLARQGVEVKQ